VQKGFDLVRQVLEELLNEADFQMVVLGTGEEQYEDFFDAMAGKYPDRLAFYRGFVPELAQKIYAGSDLFLMPSKSEPCGLAQMIALRYGTLPIVRATGGLRDSVTDFGDDQGNGITFLQCDAEDMRDAIHRALQTYHSERWPQLVLRALACDFGWARSAGEYIRLYKALAGNK